MTNRPPRGEARRLAPISFLENFSHDIVTRCEKILGKSLVRKDPRKSFSARCARRQSNLTPCLTIVVMKCGDPNNPGGPYIKHNGQPCGREVRPGMTRCNLHGGSNPSAKIKAEQMMAQARLPAIEALFRIVEQFESNPCKTCGFPQGDTDEKRMIIQACKTILDRAGMGPRATLELAKQTDGDLNLELLQPQERSSMLEALAVIKQIKESLRDRQRGVVSSPRVM